MTCLNLEPTGFVVGIRDNEENVLDNGDEEFAEKEIASSSI